MTNEYQINEAAYMAELDVDATAKLIREYMMALDLKVADISRNMGFDAPQAVYKWLNGSSMPSLSNLYRLSVLFGVRVDDLLRPVGYGKSEACVIGRERGEDFEQSSPLVFFAHFPALLP